MAKAKVTLQDIANELQLSKSLISKIINNRDVRVSEEIRKRVIAKVKELNYTPNRIASALTTKKMNLIACIVTNINYDFYSDLVYHIERQAQSHGFNIVLCNVSENPEQEGDYLQLYRSGLIDGILASSSDGESNRELYQQIRREGFPLVFVDRYIPDIGISVISTENQLSSNVLTEELIQRGHRRISFVGYGFAAKTTVQKNRYLGYVEAMKKNGLTPDLLYSSGEGDLSLENALLQKDRPTALVMISSWEIYEVLKLLKRFRIKVRHDFEIATFDEFRIPFNSLDDIQTTRVVEVPLLILKQDTKALAKSAVDLLLKQINTGIIEEVNEFIHPVQNTTFHNWKMQ